MLLTTLPFFSGAPRTSEFLADISSVMHVRKYALGDVVIRQGETAKAMFFIIKGSLKVISEDGEIDFGELSHGTFFGEIGILFDVKRTATVVAKTNCTLVTLTSEEVRQKLSKYPEIKQAMKNAAQGRLDIMTQELARAGRKPALELPSNFLEADKTRQDSLYSSRRELPILSSPSRRSSISFGLTEFATSEPSEPVLKESSHEGLDTSLAEMTASPSSLDASSASDGFGGRLRTSISRSQRNSISVTDRASAGGDTFNTVSFASDTLLPFTKLGPLEHDPKPRANQDDIKDEEDAGDADDDDDDDDDGEYFDPRYPPPQPKVIEPHPAVQNNLQQRQQQQQHLTPSQPHEQTMQSQFSNSALTRRLNEKRRVSVAVWSDDKLMQFAQNVVNQAASRESKMKSAVSADSHDSLASSDDERASVSGSSSAVWELSAYMGLDPAVLAHVFRFLDFGQLMRMRRINKTIANLILDRAHGLVSIVDLSPWHKRIDNKVVGDIMCFCGPSVVTLNLKNCWQITDQGLSRISQYTPRVRVLSLSSLWDVTDAGLSALAQNCKQLRTVELSNCRKLTDHGILDLLDNCPNLETIGLGYCKNLSDSVMDRDMWAALKRISFQRCTGLFDGGFTKWRERRPPAFRFSGAGSQAAVSPISPKAAAITAAPILAAPSPSKCVPDAAPLVTVAGISVTDVAEMDVGDHDSRTANPPIVAVSSSSNSSIASTSSINVIQGDAEKPARTSRVTIVGSGQPPAADEVLALAATVSGDVTMEDMELVSPDQSITVPSIVVPPIVTHSNQGGGRAGTDFMLPPPSPSRLMRTPKTFGMFALEELNLSDCSFLTDQTIMTLGELCPRLQRLCLSFCCSLTDKFADGLAHGCRDMDTLDVSYCGSAVTDASLQTLVRGMRVLRRLSIRGCVQVTDSGVDVLLREAASLKTINLSQCKSVSRGMLDKAGSRFELLSHQGFFDHELIATAASPSQRRIRASTAPHAIRFGTK
ncbi:hypothetical protein BC831DRAFT_460245 [Entophlyctis helioformis]|nr:hypothetical protein BC831DRAFT_460245 [Entophlyctis helioformis]